MSDILKVVWDPINVLVSIGISFIGMYSGAILYEQFRMCSKDNKPKILSQNVLLILMAFSFGAVGIWSMHFVGMASVSLFADFNTNAGIPVEIRYRIDFTIVSLIVVVLMCYLGLCVASYDKVFSAEISGAIEKFMKDARDLSIKEIQRLRKKKRIVINSLFSGFFYLLCGGLITSAGVCVMHFLGNL